jgi:hypothetical protein
VRAADVRQEQVLLRVAFGAEHLLVAQLRRLADDASFDVIVLASSTSDALLAVREESWDAAVVWDGEGDRQGLTTNVLRDVAVHLSVPATHRLAGSARVDMADLVEETIVMFPRTLSPNVWDLMRQHVLPRGASWADQIVTESNTLGPTSLMRSVAAGKGVAPVIAPLAEHADQAGTVVLPLTPSLLIPLELAWREPASAALGRVLAILRTAGRGRRVADR